MFSYFLQHLTDSFCGAIHETISAWQRMPLEEDVSALALTTDGRLFIGTQAGTVHRAE